MINRNQCWHDFNDHGNMIRRTRTLLKKILAQIGLLSAELIIIILAFIISLFAFSYLVNVVFIKHNELFDLRVFNWVESHITASNTELMQAITFFGTHSFLIPANIILLIYFLFIRRHRWYSIKVAAIALSSTAMMFFLKTLFGRERPLFPLLKPALGYSFPSGHSMMSFAFYGLLIYLSYRYIHNPILKWLFIIVFGTLIILIGFSRIYLRVHYASDVLAGFSVGTIWLIVSILVLNRLENYSRKTLKPIVEETPALPGN